MFIDFQPYIRQQVFAPPPPPLQSYATVVWGCIYVVSRVIHLYRVSNHTCLTPCHAVGVLCVCFPFCLQKEETCNLDVVGNNAAVR